MQKVCLFRGTFEFDPILTPMGGQKMFGKHPKMGVIRNTLPHRDAVR